MSQASLAEPRSVIQSIISKFHAAREIEIVQNINSAFEALQTERAQRLSASRDVLHQWMKKVEAAKWEAQRPADRSEASHAERMAQLDRDRYTLAKAINVLELTFQREEASRKTLNERLIQIQERGSSLTQMQTAVHGDALRLMMYRELGLRWVLEDQANIEEALNRSLKCRVICKQRNDIYTVCFDGPPSNPCDDAEKLWSLLA